MSASPAMSNEIGPLFMRAFGVDMSNVVGFTLRCESGELALLEIRRAAPASRLADVECAVNIVSQAYRLEPVGNAAVVSPDVSASIGTKEQTSEITLADVVAELRAIRLLLEARAASTQAVAISTVATTQFPVVI